MRLAHVTQVLISVTVDHVIYSIHRVSSEVGGIQNANGEIGSFSCIRHTKAAPVYVAGGCGAIHERWLTYFLNRAADLRWAGFCRMSKFEGTVPRYTDISGIVYHISKDLQIIYVVDNRYCAIAVYGIAIPSLYLNSEHLYAYTLLSKEV